MPDKPLETYHPETTHLTATRSCEGGPDLSEGDLRFGAECHVVRDTSLLAPSFVHSPLFRQVKLIGDRQARRVIGDRKRHRNLTIVGLAEPPAILPGDAHRMNAFLGEGRVVDNPGLDLSLRLDRRQDQFARLGQNRLVRPSRLADPVQKRLMLGRNGISKLFLTIAAAFAEAERDRIRERIGQAKADQKSRGRFLGGDVPFGFEVGADGALVPIGAQQEAIREIAALRAQGRSLRAIRDEMRAGAARSATRAWRAS